jgi:hypothetical protein
MVVGEVLARERAAVDRGAALDGGVLATDGRGARHRGAFSHTLAPARGPQGTSKRRLPPLAGYSLRPAVSSGSGSCSKREVTTMKRTTHMGAALFLLLFSGASLVACASATDAKPPAATAPTAASSPGEAPCAPTDCPPCDETKQKCTGPMVCDGHPERARRVCARDADGQCKSKLVCGEGA